MTNLEHDDFRKILKTSFQKITSSYLSVAYCCVYFFKWLLKRYVNTYYYYITYAFLNFVFKYTTRNPSIFCKIFWTYKLWFYHLSNNQLQFTLIYLRKLAYFSNVFAQFKAVLLTLLTNFSHSCKAYTFYVKNYLFHIKNYFSRWILCLRFITLIQTC